MTKQASAPKLQAAKINNRSHLLTIAGSKREKSSQRSIDATQFDTLGKEESGLFVHVLE